MNFSLKTNKNSNLNLRLKKFFSYYKPYLKLLIADILSSVLLAVIALIIPLCIRYITKNILESNLPNQLDNIYNIGFIMIGLILIQTVCLFFSDYKGHSMGAMMERDMRSELFTHLQKLPLSFYDNQKTGQIMSRLTNDLLSLTELYHHAPEDIAVNTIKFFGAFIILISINIKLTLVISIFLPIMFVFIFFINKKISMAFKKNLETIADINAQVEDNISGIRVVKAFSSEVFETKKFDFENNKFLKSRNNIYRTEAYFTAGMNIIFQFITTTIVVLGSINIINLSLSLADLITFLLYVGFLTESLPKLAHTSKQFQEGMAGFNRFVDIIEINPEIYNLPTPNKKNLFEGKVEFSNVSFRYSKNEKYVIKNVSFVAKPTEYIAIIGASGVGKTTLCSLIPRFYEIEEGNILIDDDNIKDLDLDFLRRQIGIVQQDVYLFSGTVLENIIYGKPDATKEDAINAAKNANAHSFISKLPNGYNTNIGHRGIKLSGGEKQRISIARVFIMNPQIVIFDEATSALDNESELVITDSLEKLSKNRTTFVIAHRLSTIKNAQRVLILTEDGIIEQTKTT